MFISNKRGLLVQVTDWRERRFKVNRKCKHTSFLRSVTWTRSPLLSEMKTYEPRENANYCHDIILAQCNSRKLARYHWTKTNRIECFLCSVTVNNDLIQSHKNSNEFPLSSSLSKSPSVHVWFDFREIVFSSIILLSRRLFIVLLKIVR